MKKTYRLARNTKYAVKPFGPFLSLQEAESYQADMIAGGFDVLVVNIATLAESFKTKTRQEKVTDMLKRHSLLTD